MSDMDPNANWWCWTEDEPSTFHCRERGHDVRPYDKVRSFAEDPAVKPWREAMELSTSARLRALERQLAAAHAEIARLRSAAAHRPGAYHLTDQGRAALAADTKEPS